MCDYMLDNIPAGSKVLVISGGEGTWRSDLRTRGGAKGEQLLDTWELRSYIDETTAKEWAAGCAMSRGSGAKTLWVCFFTDGEVGGTAATESTSHFNDWGFDVIKIAGFLLSHGAHFVYIHSRGCVQSVRRSRASRARLPAARTGHVCGDDEGAHVSVRPVADCLRRQGGQPGWPLHDGAGTPDAHRTGPLGRSAPDRHGG